MKLVFFRGSEPNFGDELSSWLMPKVFPDLLDDDERVLLLGVGSILVDSFSSDVLKVVFGSGYGGYSNAPEIDNSWDVVCVRGPLTAKRLGLHADIVAGDAALLIADHRPPSHCTGPVSFMPHFESIRRGNWQKVCKAAGINFIDPRWPVEKILDFIQDSSLIVSEAMHGIIVADALRVPWIALKSIDCRHHFKWNDWSAALDLNIEFERLEPSSFSEFFLMQHQTKLQKRGLTVSELGLSRPSLLAKFLGKLFSPIDIFLRSRSIRSLQLAAKRSPTLSNDLALAQASAKLHQAADRIRKAYGRT